MSMSDPPLLQPGAPWKLSAAAVSFAKSRPEYFVSYLRRIWEKEGQQIMQESRPLGILCRTKVLYENGVIHRLDKSWIPLPELRCLCSQFLLPGESFNFIHLDPPLPEPEEDGNLGSYDFLKDLRCQTKPDATFYIDLLIAIQAASPNVPASPRRVLDLYLLIFSHYLGVKSSGDQEETNQLASYIRGKFNSDKLVLHSQGWTAPGSAVRNGPMGMFSKQSLMPLPAGWNATPNEKQKLDLFYVQVLEIPDSENKWEWIRWELELHRKSRSTKRHIYGRMGDIAQLYRSIQNVTHNEEDKERVRSEFSNTPYIVCRDKCDDRITWVYLDPCVWSPGVDLKYTYDVSGTYPDMKSFFVDFLGVPELTMKNAHTELLHLSNDALVQRTMGIFSALNDLVRLGKNLMSPGEFIESQVFPVITPKGELKRVSGDAEFFIPDDTRLFKSFSSKVNMLALHPSQGKRLAPLFDWLDLKHRYLTKRVHETSTWPVRANYRQIEWDLPQKAEAIVQIAAHFRSPRMIPHLGEDLLKTVQDALIFEVDDMVSESTLLTSPGPIYFNQFEHSDAPKIKVTSTYPQVKLGNWRVNGVFGNEVNELIVHVPTDKTQQQLALAVALPRQLMQWIMMERWHDPPAEITDLGVSLMKSVLNAPPHLVNDILEAEGIEQPVLREIHIGRPIVDEGFKIAIQRATIPPPTIPAPKASPEPKVVPTYPIRTADQPTTPQRKILTPKGPKRSSPKPNPGLFTFTGLSPQIPT